MADKALTLRLNKVLRELNISLDRAVEYLSDVGCDIEARPTTKISKETYELLLEGFKIDKSKKDESAEISEEKRKEKEKKKKRTSFRALTFAQIMTQRMQKSESGIVLKKEGQTTQKAKTDKKNRRRSREDFKAKFERFKIVSETGKMIDTSVTYNGEDIFQEMTFKDRVESFFKYYNPEKLNDGDFLKTVLKTYENRKDILIEQLTSVYVYPLSQHSQMTCQ